MRRSRTTWVRAAVAGALLAAGAVAIGSAAPAQAYEPITGGGSTWSGNFIDSMRVNVAQFDIVVNYNPVGSTTGRSQYLLGQYDFAASDIPFQINPEDGSQAENPDAGSYVYIPVTAGGTAFVYNLKINGQRVTNLRLSGENIAKIFTGVITMWNDPAIQADNPGIVMPAREIVPVVRSDGSGSTAQFTMWMINRHPQLWTEYCARVGRQNRCGFTSFYPKLENSRMQAHNGDPGVIGYVTEGFAEGAIGYVNYSYSLDAQFPVAKVLNAAGYYTEPTPENVAVSLLQADVETQNTDPAVYLTQKLEGVYANADPRNYELSSYSYLILPARLRDGFTDEKGETLAEFARYSMCQGQQQSASLGYSPMPVNLVQRSFEQIAKVPGAGSVNMNIAECDNPTFSANGDNLLAANAPMPQPCDQAGQYQCPDGTGGLSNVPTAVSAIIPQPGQNPTGDPSQPGQNPTGDPSQPGQNPTGDPNQPGQSPTGDASQPGQSATGDPSDPAAPGQTPSDQANAPGQANNPGSNNNGTSNPAGGPVITTAPCATTTTTTLPSAAPASPTTSSTSTTTSTTTTTTTTTTVAGSEASSTTTTTLPPCQPTTTIAGVPLVGQASNAESGTPVAAGCDPDTGAGCTPGPSADSTQQLTNPTGLPMGAVTPTTLEQRSRWSSSQTLIVLVSMLTVGAVLGPAAAWRYFGMKKAVAT